MNGGGGRERVTIARHGRQLDTRQRWMAPRSARALKRIEKPKRRRNTTTTTRPTRSTMASHFKIKSSSPSLSRRGLMVCHYLFTPPSKHLYAGCTFFVSGPSNRGLPIWNVSNQYRERPHSFWFDSNHARDYWIRSPPKQRSIKNRLFFGVT